MRKLENALFAKEVPDPRRIISQRLAKPIKCNTMFDPRIDRFDQCDEIADRTKMNVGRLIPGKLQILGQWHMAAERHLHPDPPMPEIGEGNDRVAADPQHMFEHFARLPRCLQGLR
jgi:hypothetical protein